MQLDGQAQGACLDEKHRFGPVASPGARLTHDAGPEQGCDVRLVAFQSSFPPSSAPPYLDWIYVEGPPSGEAAQVEASAAAAGRRITARSAPAAAAGRRN
jgi:hypothetical protein